MTSIDCNVLAVGLGELRTTRAGELVAYSLGSCVAVCLFDPAERVAGMAHVVLPSAPPSYDGTMPGRYAETAVPALIAALEAHRGARHRLTARIAGGAAVLGLKDAFGGIGARNVAAVKAALARHGVPILAEATGGEQGRTVRLQAPSGRVLVRTVQGVEVEL